MSNRPTKSKLSSAFGKFFFGDDEEARHQEELELYWKQSLIVATRKLQQVHQAIAHEVHDVKGLRGDFQNTSPELQRLTEELRGTRTLVNDLRGQLEGHSRSMRDSLDSIASPFPGGAAGPVGTLDTGQPGAGPGAVMAEGLDEAARAQIEIAQRAEIARMAEQYGARIGQLELELEAANQRAGQVEDPAVAAQAQARLEQLETQLTDAVGLQRQFQHRHRNKVMQIRSQYEARVSGLEAQVKELRDSRAELIRSHEQFRTESTDQIRLLQDAVRSAEEQVKLERANSSAQAGAVPGSEVDSDRLKELEEQVKFLEDVRSKLDVRHSHELAQLKRKNAKRVKELEAQAREFEEQAKALTERHAQERARLAEGAPALDLAGMPDQDAAQAVQAAKEEMELRHSEEVARLTERATARITELESQAREQERTRIELEGQHLKDTIELADESRRRIVILEKVSREKDEGISSMYNRMRHLEETVSHLTAELCEREDRLANYETITTNLELRNRELESLNSGREEASEELLRLHGDIRESGNDIEARATHILDLIRTLEVANPGYEVGLRKVEG